MAMASAFVDGALQDIELLPERLKMLARTSSMDGAVNPLVQITRNHRLKDLQVRLRNLRTFLLCARGCSSSSVMGSLLSRLEDSLIQNGKDFHNLCHRENDDDLLRGVNRFHECIRPFSQEIIESYITLSDHWSWQSGYQLKEFCDSLLVNMADMMWHQVFCLEQDPNLLESIKDKLVFFINFFRFAELRGSEPCQLQALRARLSVVGFNAARLCYYWTSSECIDQWTDLDEFKLEFSELLLKINPADPQICETYVPVLTATNVSRSSHVLTLETDKHVLGDFVDSLLYNISELLMYDDNYMVSLKDQVPVLFDGLRFLRTILMKHLEKIDELHKKAKDIIGAAVNEAAIVICLHPVHELEEGLLKEMDFALLNFLEKIKLIKVITSAFIFSKSDEHGFTDFLLENLKELPSCKVDSIAFAKEQIQTVQEDLVSLRSFLESILGDHKHDVELQRLWNRVIGVAYKTHFVILSLVVGDIPNCCSLEFRTIIEEINLIKLESLKIVDNHDNSDSEAQKATHTSNPLPSQGSTPSINEIVLTLDAEANTIIEHLTRGSEKLDIISIVGMPGLGKTTLARSVYDNPSVRDLFHSSAWCVVSHAYKKKDLLLQILSSVDPDFSGNEYSEDNEQGLEEQLKKCLLRKRYFIVLDDVWDVEAWSCLERSFPDDVNYSRILLTSRDFGVAKKINPNREPHPLRQLTDDECWELLQMKLSCLESYPLDLGMKIAKNCRGLPLTVVVTAGILTNSDQDNWEEITRRLSLSALSDTNQCMDMVELSFRKLPEKLKSCLLYLGSFSEDKEILVKNLIWLWIAEGFIEKSERKSLEDVAKDYMNDLIGRSLVMVSKKKSTGGIKTCRIHDLLHEFCVIKVKKEKFMSLLSGHDELFTFLGQCDLQRLCVHSTLQDFEKSKLSGSEVRSLLFFAEGYSWACPHRPRISFIFHIFKHLKVLNLINVSLGLAFPSEIVLLIELSYLSIEGMFESIPSAVANISNLETLLVYANGILLYANDILLPGTIWNMPKVRVLWSSAFFAITNFKSSSDLQHLDTFSTLRLSFGQSLEKIMRKLPNIRKLKCVFHKSGESNADCNGIVVMDFLSQLESLHLILPTMDKYHIGFHFPMNLKKLTLSRFHSCTIPKGGELPDLVVLKLLNIDFEGGTWDMNEEWEFPNLKLLELCHLNIDKWIGIDGVDHFPCLEKLVLRRCYELKEVPSCLREIMTLQMIEVDDCPKSVASLIMQIKEYQKDEWGNEDLRVLLERISEVEPNENERVMKNEPTHKTNVHRFWQLFSSWVCLRFLCFDC